MSDPAASPDPDDSPPPPPPDGSSTPPPAPDDSPPPPPPDDSSTPTPAPDDSPPPPSPDDSSTPPPAPDDSPPPPPPDDSQPPPPTPDDSPPPPPPDNSPPPVPPPYSPEQPAPAPVQYSLIPPAAHNPKLAPRDQTGPPANRSVVGIAAGSAGAATILLVLALYLVAVLRKRRTGQGGGAVQGTTLIILSGSSCSQQHQPSSNIRSPISPAAAEPCRLQKPYPDVELRPARIYSPISPPAAEPRQSQKLHSVEQLTPPPTASSSDVSSAAPISTSTESFKSERPEPLDGLRVQRAPGSGEILFRGAFAYEELATATNGFSHSNLVGRGGFGDVYYGMVDGTTVAVKRLRAGSQQGDREFQAELQIIGRVHHRNLVSLVGYCVAVSGQLLLVYEFVPNMTLHHHLHGIRVEVEAVLNWPTRWKIAVGAAKGLAYLHEDCHPRIIHRDIKASNILLDADFNPKVSDFGMAKFIPRGDTHISTRVVGTTGYLAPEYASSGRVTEKSDVFSYGVVLLEIITGMNVALSSDPDTEDTLVSWARPLLTQALEHRDYAQLVDPLLASFDAVQMERLVRCAAAAVSTSARRRPRMSQIVRHFEGEASAEEIDACGVRFFGVRGSAYGDTSAQSRPARYDEIRTSRREARVRKLHQS